MGLFRKKSTFTPQYQVNGPYKAYTERHERIRQEQSSYLILLLFPTSLYMFTQNGIFLLIGAVYIILVVLTINRKKAKLFDEYTEIEQKNLKRLNDVLTGFGISENRQYAFGYLRAGKSFKPVLLIRDGDKLYRMDNPFAKNVIYGIEAQTVYLFDLKEDVLKRTPEELDPAAVSWDLFGKTHQEMLREEAIRMNQYFAIEFFIYEEILETMKKGKRKEMVHVEYSLSQIAKEKVYEGTIHAERKLYLPAGADKVLGLVPEDVKTKKKGK